MTDCAVGFIDLAGFTALTEAHGDLNAIEVLSRFSTTAKNALDEGDRLIKTIGDSLLVTSPTATSGLRLIRRMCQRLYAEPGFPLTSIGMHCGSIIERDGDIFGSVVNLAARVTAFAAPGQTLVTHDVIAQLDGSEYPPVSIGNVRLKNVPYDVELFEIPQCASIATAAIDPVCHMRVEPRLAASHLLFDGVEYQFCSTVCANLFSSAPTTYAR